jgi:hypothetical protein
MMNQFDLYFWLTMTALVVLAFSIDHILPLIYG